MSNRTMKKLLSPSSMIRVPRWKRGPNILFSPTKKKYHLAYNANISFGFLARKKFNPHSWSMRMSGWLFVVQPPLGEESSLSFLWITGIIAFWGVAYCKGWGLVGDAFYNIMSRMCVLCMYGMLTVGRVCLKYLNQFLKILVLFGWKYIFKKSFSSIFHIQGYRIPWYLVIPRTKYNNLSEIVIVVAWAQLYKYKSKNLNVFWVIHLI